MFFCMSVHAQKAHNHIYTDTVFILKFSFQGIYKKMCEEECVILVMSEPADWSEK